VILDDPPDTLPTPSLLEKTTVPVVMKPLWGDSLEKFEMIWNLKSEKWRVGKKEGGGMGYKGVICVSSEMNQKWNYSNAKMELLQVI
jgi:hypothetical protein